jgi:hypothetical protein
MTSSCSASTRVRRGRTKWSSPTAAIGPAKNDCVPTSIRPSVRSPDITLVTLKKTRLDYRSGRQAQQTQTHTWTRQYSSPNQPKRTADGQPDPIDKPALNRHPRNRQACVYVGTDYYERTCSSSNSTKVSIRLCRTIVGLPSRK